MRGEIRVQSFTSDPKAIGAYGPLTDSTRAKVFAFERLRPVKDDMLVVKVAGVDTREAAAALTGAELFARRLQLPPPSEDEFYYDDLVGLDAVTPAGEPLGRVSAVSNYGAGDILEIATQSNETLLFPFTRAVATAIDFGRGRIVIAAPEEVDARSETP